MNFSRRGGTKLLNYAGASGRETCVSYARLTPKEKGEAHYGGACIACVPTGSRMSTQEAPHEGQTIRDL
jgi:hypothetical protein